MRSVVVEGGALFFLLFLCLFLGECYADKIEENGPLTFTLYRGKYVTWLASSSGREVTLRVRFDVNSIVLYAPPDPRDYSSTVEFEADGSATEIFYLGSHRFRFPVKYLPMGALGDSDPEETGDRVSHQGVLGLGDGSPLWMYWNSWTWSRMHLTLGAAHKALQRTHHLISQDLSASSTLVACWDQMTHCARAMPRPEKDFTFMSSDMFAEWLLEHDTDKVQPYALWSESHEESCSAAVHGGKQCPPHNNVVRVFLDSQTSDENDQVIRKMRQSFDDSFSEENVSTVSLGLEHLATMILSKDIVTKQMLIAGMPLWFIDHHDYLWLWAGLLVLFLLWYPGTYESVHIAHWNGTASAAAKLRPPNPSLVGQFWITRVSAWLAILAIHWMLKPYLALRMIDHPYANTSGWSDTIYAILLLYVFTVTVCTPSKLSRVAVMHTASALLCLGWLLVVLEFHSGLNQILMIASSFTIFFLQAELLNFELFTKRKRSIRLLVSAACTLTAAWFFAFYNVAFYIEQRWPEHPSSLPLQFLALVASWFLLVFLPFIDEHLVQYLSFVNAQIAAMQKPANAQASVASSSTTTPSIVITESRRTPYVLGNESLADGSTNTYSPVLAIQT